MEKERGRDGERKIERESEEEHSVTVHTAYMKIKLLL